jgi:hypothetical protein
VAQSRARFVPESEDCGEITAKKENLQVCYDRVTFSPSVVGSGIPEDVCHSSACDLRLTSQCGVLFRFGPASCGAKGWTGGNTNREIACILGNSLDSCFCCLLSSRAEFFISEAGDILIIKGKAWAATRT